MTRSRVMIGAVVAGALSVTGCESSEPESGPGGGASPRSSTNAYVPPRLPVDCEAVAAHIPAQAVSDFGLVANASPDPRLGLLQCSGRGTSPDGGMEVYVLFQVRVMPPEPDDPQGRRLTEWQHDNAQSVTDGVCEGRAQPATAARYTVRCVMPEPDGARAGRGAVGPDGRVAGGEVTVSGVDASAVDAAGQFADRVAAAVVDAGLIAR